MIIKYESVPVSKVKENIGILLYFDPNLQGFSIKDKDNPRIRTIKEVLDDNCEEVEQYWSKIDGLANPPIPFPKFNNPFDFFLRTFKDYGTSAVEAYSVYTEFMKNMKPALKHEEIIETSERLQKEKKADDKVDISYWATNAMQRKFLENLYEKEIKERESKA